MNIHPICVTPEIEKNNILSFLVVVVVVATVLFKVMGIVYEKYENGHFCWCYNDRKRDFEVRLCFH